VELCDISRDILVFLIINCLHAMPLPKSCHSAVTKRHRTSTISIRFDTFKSEGATGDN
jgi:hypothetical protein